MSNPVARRLRRVGIARRERNRGSQSGDESISTGATSSGRCPTATGQPDHPAIRHLDLPPLGQGGRAAPLVTKSLVFLGEGAGTRRPPPWHQTHGSRSSLRPFRIDPMSAQQIVVSLALEKQDCG